MIVQQNGFDNEKYLKEQTAAILERVSLFDNKLYLECGGKLLFDYHASRVLPGFDPNVKMRVFQAFKEKIDVIICIYAGDIEKKKIRADFGITYDTDTLKMIDDFVQWDLNIAGVVITRFEGQPAAVQFKNRLERRGLKVYTHKFTKGYPTDVDIIVSDDGYGANEYIETTRPVVVVTAPGPGSGKLATCLSQFYHDYRRGIRSGYAKLETFPIWNLPLRHPVNIAYEAATADLGDINQIDSFHLEVYGDDGYGEYIKKFRSHVKFKGIKPPRYSYGKPAVHAVQKVVRDFRDYVLSDKKHLCTGQDAIRVIEAVNYIYDSLEEI